MVAGPARGLKELKTLLPKSYPLRLLFSLLKYQHEALLIYRRLDGAGSRKR